jgi:hypothetical protein
MSTKRLTHDERATFLIGQAFRRYIESGKDDAAVRKLVWDTYVRVVDAELTPDEHGYVMVTTGFTDSSWFDPAYVDPPVRESDAGDLTDDELPF